MEIDRKQYLYKSLETLFKDSPDPIIHIDPDHVIIDANQAFIDLFGYDPDEVIGRHIDDLMNSGKPGSANTEHTAAVLAGKKISDETTRYNKAGLPIEVILKAIPILINETLAGAYVFYVDITERKEAEKKLKERENRLNTIFEGSHEAITILSQDGIFIDCNRSAIKMFGLQDKEEFCTTRPADFSPVFQPDGSRSLEKSREKIAEALEADGHIHFEWVHRRKNGETFSTEVMLKTYSLDGKNVVQGTIRDITSRKQAEQKLIYMSYHDSLTGTYNRSYLDIEISRLDTKRQLPISIIMADLNGLKLINDTYGHTTGDEALKKTSVILQRSCRQEDIIARWGGDEFVIFLPQTDAEEALMISKRITSYCNDIHVEEIPVSMALGVATKTSETGTLTETLREAENNMYKQKLTESRSAKNALLKTLLKTLSEKSFETEAHTLRMQAIAQKIGESLELPDAEINRLNLLITLHDIGKINISEDILTKKEALTPEEWKIIKKHPEIGYRIARATEEFTHVADDILAHHECWDGTGYPRGLKSRAIPLLARITAIADAVEVMSYGRPYKSALSSDQIEAELKKCAGKQFDPGLVEIYLSLKNKTTPSAS